MARIFKHIPEDKDERVKYLYGIFKEYRPQCKSTRNALLNVQHRVENEIQIRALERMAKAHGWEQQFENEGLRPDPAADPQVRQLARDIFAAMGLPVDGIPLPFPRKEKDEEYTHEEKRTLLRSIFHYWVEGRYHMDALCSHHGIAYHQLVTWCNDDNDLFEMLERAERATSLRRNMLFREGAFLRIIEQFERPTYEEITKEYTKVQEKNEEGIVVDVWKETAMRISVKRNKIDAAALSWAVAMAQQLQSVNVTRPLNAVERVDQMSFEELDAKEKELMAIIRDKTQVRDQLLAGNEPQEEQSNG